LIKIGNDKTLWFTIIILKNIFPNVCIFQSCDVSISGKINIESIS